MNAEEILNKHLSQIEAREPRTRTAGDGCAVATGSLPGSLVDEAVFFLSYGARMADELGRPTEANRMLSVAASLKWRAQEDAAAVRQPKEN